MTSTSLPQEIILLLCQELTARLDFGTLFRCSLVSRRIASIALEQIYNIQELSPTSTGDAYNKLEWSRLWRSIILSSIGKTAYPYCVYVRSLSLGNLNECLQDIVRDRHVSDFFFGGPMEQFLVLHQDRSWTVRTQKLGPSHLINFSGTMTKCADSITKYIKTSADETGTSVALAHLEGIYIPHDILPNWITRLRSLTSLRIRDGSVLGVEAASAVSQYCPSFADLTCYYCSSADEDLAAFFLALRPNTLRSFEIISQNGIGENALTALNAHATSLRTLLLGSLSPRAMKALNSLSKCTALETLLIENNKLFNQVDLGYFSEEVLREVIVWISNCKSLKDLSLVHILNALPMVKEVLKSPEIRLTSLSVVDFHSGAEEEDDATWAALGSQVHLESLTLGLLDGIVNGLMLSQTPVLVDSICHLENLTSLNLMQSYITDFEVECFASVLSKLSEFSFSGDVVNDAVLDILSNLSRLKLLSINAISVFSFEGLEQFSRKFNTPDRMGIKVDILNQLGECKFGEAEYAWLQQYFTDTLKGRIEITYFMDPDELHEMDFSDTSD
ncbi:hypothetical protein F4804DRAFT_334105 [Jackrogersella minutella]|nr:hypothetical protein F4804DRAFT_334105 [Jackrogersella minutella]